jgi:toxin FitB
LSYLLDTNVVSEPTRPQPDTKVLRWLAEVDEDRVFLSVVTLAEVRRGTTLMQPGRRRQALEDLLATDLPDRFLGRILDVDRDAADRWGKLMADSSRRGIALSVMDGLLAATALSRRLTLVTRNTKDFLPFGIPVFDPWTA